MSELRVEPGGYRIDVQPGESLIEAAWRAQYWWPTLCYGVGQCTACGCEVIEGLDRLSARTEPEERMLRAAARGRRRVDPQRLRLACQVTITGDVTVRKPGVRPDTVPVRGEGGLAAVRPGRPVLASRFARAWRGLFLRSLFRRT